MLYLPLGERDLSHQAAPSPSPPVVAPRERRPRYGMLSPLIGIMPERTCRAITSAWWESRCDGDVAVLLSATNAEIAMPRPRQSQCEGDVAAIRKTVDTDHRAIQAEAVAT
jgi:hypothetical protein